MKGTFCLKIYFLVLGFQISTSCLFKQKTGRQPDKPNYIKLENAPHDRIFYKNATEYKCTCLDAQTAGSQYLFIVFYKSELGNDYALCSATLIASNLLITSNKCFLKPNETMQPYDAWPNAKGKRHTYDKEDLYVIWSYHLNTWRENWLIIEIEKIILNPGYAASAQTDRKFPVDDVALIVTKINLIELGVLPICLPDSTTTHKPEDVFYRLALYEGIGGIAPDDPTTEKRGGIYGVTLSSKNCFLEINPGFGVEKYLICLRFRLPAPSTVGGPLIIWDKQGRTFLVGIASQIGYSQTLANFHYAFFTNIFPLLKYIEHFAFKAKSLWCDASQIDLNMKRIVGEIKSKPLPYEASYVPPPRNETLNCVCGIKNLGDPSATSRIAGGETAVPHEFPWMAKLFIKSPTGLTHCTGSIINDRMLLTAAHCVVPGYLPAPKESDIYPPADVYPFLRQHFEKIPVHAVQVAKIIVHPDYFASRALGFYDSDIALLVLTQPIPKNPNLVFLKGETVAKVGVRPICLPKFGDQRMDLVGKVAVNSGWGITDVTKPNSDTVALKKINLPVLPLADCVKNARAVITDNVICAGYQNITQSSGSGDSGGPLFLEYGPKNRRTQIGLVSFDARNPKKINDTYIVWGPHPAFYVDVQKYTRFIDYYATEADAQWCKS